MFTQLREPNNEYKPAYKNTAHIAIEQTTASRLISKYNKMMKTKETHMLDLNLHKNLLYNTFAVRFVKTTRTEQKTNLHTHLIDTVVDEHHVIVIQIAKFHHKIDIVPILETDKDMKKPLLLHTITDQDMTTIDENRVLIVHYTDLQIDHHID